MEPEYIKQNFGVWALNFPDQFSLADWNEEDGYRIAKIVHSETGVARFFPYHYHDGQCTWGKWFAGGHTVGAIAYVSRPYTTKASIRRTLH
jgi:nuclear transport factor 2 (NTF2) superfamily protein